MAGDKARKRKDGARGGKRTKAMRQDVAARRVGDEAGRPRTKRNVPKAAKAGRQKAR